MIVNQIQRGRQFVSDNSNFLKLWLAQLFTQSAVSSITIIVGILSDEGVLSSGTKGSAVSIAVIVNLAMFPGLIIGPIAGVFADWFPKKRIMMLSNLWRFVFLFFFIVIQGWRNQFLAYTLILSESIILQFFMPAEGGILPSLVKKKYILFANSLFSLTVYSTLGVGVAFSGVLLSFLGIRGAFIACALFFMTSIGLLTRVHVPREKKKDVSMRYLLDFLQKLIKDAKEGIRYSFSVSALRFALTHLFLLQIVGLTLVSLIFRIGEEVYGVSPRSAGVIVLSPLIIGLVLGFLSLNIFGRKIYRIKLIWIGSLFSIIGFGLMTIMLGANDSLADILLGKILASVSLGAIGLALPFILIPAQTLIYENAKFGFRGRVLGVWFALTSSLASIVALAAGFFTDRSGDIFYPITGIVIGNIVYSVVLFVLSKKKNL